MANMKVSWVNSVPSNGFAANSIYMVKPATGNKPLVFITNKEGNQIYQINPDVDTSAFVKTINGISGTSGNVALSLSYNSDTHELSLSGSSTKINLSAYLVKLSDFTTFRDRTNERLTALESTVTQGLKTPKAFDASSVSAFPRQEAGFTYKVTVAGTVGGVKLEVGDTIIYDTAGTTPFIVQGNLDSATNTVKGIVMLATQDEVNVGTVSDKAVVPSTLQAKINALYASQDEVNAGTNETKFVTPKTLNLKLQTLANAAHNHTNLPILEKFTENAGTLNYNGVGVYTLGTQEW